jgi:Sulfotransferase family
MKVKLLRILCNRLRMQRDFINHPEIHEHVICAPIVAAGALRTGSTKIQRLFSASGDFNWLPFWKSLNSASYSGVPGEDVSARIADADEYVRVLNEGSPQAVSTHEMGTHLAEEESIIMIQGLRCSGFMGYANVPGYLNWLSSQDPVGIYEYLRDTLKYLAWQGLADSSKRWFLKTPWHCGMERALTTVFPDAMMIFTHRPPSDFVPSMCSMLSSYIESHSYHTDVDSQAVLAGVAQSLDAHLEFVKAHPEFPVIDIHYRDTTGNIEQVITQVYDFIGVPLSIESLTRMLIWDRENPIHKKGVHRYLLEDVGLTQGDVESQCRNYLAFYYDKFNMA